MTKQTSNELNLITKFKKIEKRLTAEQRTTFKENMRQLINDKIDYLAELREHVSPAR